MTQGEWVMENATRITIKEASKALGIHEDSVRYLMKKGKLPIGIVRTSKKRNTYYVYREMLERFLKVEGS